MRRTIRKRTMAELKQAIYDDRGWQRKAGESMGARIKPLYDVRADHQRGEIVATLKPQSGQPPEGQMSSADNLPILYENILCALPSDLSRDAFLWAVERPGEDRMCYRAEAFAREVDRIANAVAALIDLSNWSKFQERVGIVLDKAANDDMLGYILTRHANYRYGGNLAPGYAK